MTTDHKHTYQEPINREYKMMLLSSSLTRLSIILAFAVLQQGSNDICAANETADLKNLDYGGAVDGDGDERELQGAPVSNPASSFWMDFLGASGGNDHDHDDEDDHDLSLIHI